MNLAVRIPERGWKTWAEALAGSGAVRTVETAASLALDTPAFSETLERLGFSVHHVHGLVAPATAAHIFDAPPSVQDDFRVHLRSLLNRADTAGIRTLDLDLGLERISGTDVEAQLSGRVAFLRSLLDYGAESTNSPQVCISVRFPLPFPGAKTWDWAANLIYETMHPRYRLAVDIFPAELPSGFDVPAFVREWYLQAVLIRFHWRPSQGEHLDTQNQKQWAAALRRRAFKGTIIFCPGARRAESAPAISEEIRALCSLYKTGST